VRLYLDENLSPRVAERLRARGVDATSAHDVGNKGLDDRSQLGYAVREGRAIVSKDIADFVALAEEAVAANAHHAGIVLVPTAFRRSEVDALASAIEAIARSFPDGIAASVLVVTRPKS